VRRALAKRIDKLEDAGKPVVRAPHVLHIRHGETTADARARFSAAYPDLPRGHRLLIVPNRVRTVEDEADFARRFKVQQEALVAEARSSRPTCLPSKL
jgi:hypothetical protein